MRKTQTQTNTENQSMFQVVRLYRFETDRPLKAFADVSISDSVLVKGIRVLADKEGGLYVSMPREKAKDGRFYESVRILTSETREALQNAVLEAYNS